MKFFNAIFGLLLVMPLRAGATDSRATSLNPQGVAPPKTAGYLTRDGAIAIVGYNDMAEMIAALDTRFAADHPGFTFAPDLKGTRTGPPALAAGRSALAPMGAEFSPRELADYRTTTGTEPLGVRVAHASLNPHALSGPLAIFVHRNNPLAALTMAEIAAIFTGSDRSRGLILYGLEAETALGLFFRQRALGGHDLAADLKGFLQSADVVQRVAADERAIGFAAAMRATPEVKILALAVRASEPPVALNAENLVAGRYPLDRHLLIYARPPLEPWVREYLRFVLSSEGQQIIAAGTLGYLPLSGPDAARARAQLDAAP